MPSCSRCDARYQCENGRLIFNVPDNTQNYTSPEKPEYDVSQAYRMDCVMGYNRYESYIEQNLTICDYCKNIAKLQKYSFYNH